MIYKHQQKQKDLLVDLNLKDEQKNSLFHHLFSGFAQSMELSVELCQEILKFGERFMTEMGGIKLNETNRQGETPVDLAIEIKQN